MANTTRWRLWGGGGGDNIVDDGDNKKGDVDILRFPPLHAIVAAEFLTTTGLES